MIQCQAIPLLLRIIKENSKQSSKTERKPTQQSKNEEALTSQNRAKMNNITFNTTFSSSGFCFNPRSLNNSPEFCAVSCKDRQNHCELNLTAVWRKLIGINKNPHYIKFAFSYSLQFLTEKRQIINYITSKLQIKQTRDTQFTKRVFLTQRKKIRIFGLVVGYFVSLNLISILSKLTGHLKIVLNFC